MDERETVKKRLLELGRKSRDGGYFLFSDFLGLSEQSCLSEIKEELRGAVITTFGGAEGAERVMLRFGDAEEIGYEADFPIECLKIEPLSQKFADRLTHRDFLGALLNLGIERSTMGDIPIIDNVGYLFCKCDISEYIITSLTRVKHTDVKLSRISTLPEGELYRTERRRLQAVGERLDAVIAKLFKISREDSLTLFKRHLVFINGTLCENNSKAPKCGDVISVRGYGRFIYRGYDSLTKKGKLNLEVDVYI